MNKLSGSPVAGVIGWPVAHSLSPRLHGFWLAQHGIDGAYVPLAVTPENLEPALRALPALGFAGVNVTLPHKQRACVLVDDIDPWARRVGAVNTIIVSADGAIRGINSDGFGFLENMTEKASSWQAGQGPVTVIGAGGAARPIVAALIDAGVDRLRLVNRSPGRAEALADQLGQGRARVIPWARRAEALGGAGLVVNATSLGMTGQPELDLALDDLAPDAVVCDIVYRPLATPLLRAARARGNPTVDGLGMLLHQARPGFAAWFGVEPGVTPALRARLIEALG